MALIPIACSSLVGFAAIVAGCVCACGSSLACAGDRGPETERIAFAEADTATSRPAAEPVEGSARFAAVPCWFRVASDREIDCGELTVPENWSKPESAITLSVLGELYNEQGRVGEAEEVFTRALAINSKLYGPDSLEAGKSAGRLAVALHEQGKIDEAASRYRRALRILEREYGEQHADVSFHRNRYRDLMASPTAGEALIVGDGGGPLATGPRLAGRRSPISH